MLAVGDYTMEAREPESLEENGRRHPTREMMVRAARETPGTGLIEENGAGN
jgi:hypothetical protein